MAEETDELSGQESITDTNESRFGSTGQDAGGLDIQSGDEDGVDSNRLLRSQIENTRQQMGETIDAIQEKLSISNISEQVSEQVSTVIESAKNDLYDATIGKMVNFMKNAGQEISGTAIGRTVRSNPFPFLLIAAGAGLLVYNNMQGKRGSRYLNRAAQPRGGEGSQTLLSSAQGKISDIREGVSGAAGNAYSTVADTAAGMYQGVADSANNAMTSVNEFSGRAYDKLGELGSAAQERYEYHVEENPLAVGAVALAVGAAIGFAIPSTRYENQLMGEASQNLMQKARNSAGGLVERVKEVATEAGENLKGGMKSEGIIH